MRTVSFVAMVFGAIVLPALAAPTSKVQPLPAKATKTPAPPQPPYQFRGATLGMPLSEFRALAYPDAEERNNAATQKCTGDLRTSYGYDPMAVDKIDETVGLTKCRWMIPPRAGSYQTSWYEAQLSVGDSVSMSAVYLFSRDESGESKLMEIIILLRHETFGSVLAALNEKFGTPSSVEDGEVKNGFGNSFSSKTFKWDNGTSQIELEGRAGKIDQSALFYRHSMLSQQYNAQVKAAKGAPKL